MEFISYNDWAQLPASANLLFNKSEQDSIFFSRDWFENLSVTALKKGQIMLLACVIEGHNIQAILPLTQRDNDDWYSLSTSFTSLYTVLMANDEQDQILNCLCHGLKTLPFKYLRLYPVADGDENINRLQRIMESSGFSCNRHFSFYNWVLNVQGQSFADYMESRPSRVKNTIARKQRKLKREQGYDIRVYTDNDLTQALTDYHLIYNASWKANEAFVGFSEKLVLCLAKPGWLRLGILYIGGQPAAAQIWFSAHGKASIYRLVYDQAWKKYSPGSILTKHLMHHVIDVDQVKTVDFLTGNDAYKRDWMSERNQRWALDCTLIEKPERGFMTLINPLRKLLT